MPTIRQLSTSVINKIAAGEVIERPASVVKELLENAVDAGATRIDVHLESGGCDLVRITDNGCGIEPEQLMLAVASHATSKIVDADDLFRVATLGFRGEALASIAEISQLTIRSRTADSTEGAELVVHGGVAQPIMPCAAPIGTTLEVRNLFFNTPVRRKFLRQAQTEIGHCTEAFTRIALASEHIHFTLRHNERLLFDLPAGDWRRRIGLLIGKEIELALIPIEAADDSTKLYGYTCDPQQNRSSNKLQYLFLNGRHIRDRSLQHALSEAYRGLLLTGRFPICFLRIEMPADTVDVNVHPSKLEVRFQDGGRLYSMILGTLRKKFLATDLTARLHRPQGATETATSSMDESALAAHRRELVDWAKGALGQPVSDAPAARLAAADLSQGSLAALYEQNPDRALSLTTIAPPVNYPAQYAASYASRASVDAAPVEAPLYPGSFHVAHTAPPAPLAAPSSADLLLDPALDESTAVSPEPRELPAVRPRLAPGVPVMSSIGFQVHQRYLVTENDEGMVVIDQHALHERILYEQLKTKVMSGKLECQRLLVPEPVTLTPSEAVAVLEARETLSTLAIDVEPFGGDTVLVSSYPAMLSGVAVGPLLRHVVDQLVAGNKGVDRRNVLDDLLNMIACKAAIKAGDRLSPEEITALLLQRNHYENTHHCPHGRPTALVFSREELDKRFKRT